MGAAFGQRGTGRRGMPEASTPWWRREAPHGTRAKSCRANVRMTGRLRACLSERRCRDFGV